MAISRHCGDALVTVTLILAVIFVVILILNILATFVIPTNIEKFLSIMSCTASTGQVEIYQHSGFWVLQNFVQANGSDRCMKISMAMQGDYRDIYKLRDLYMGELQTEPLSFSVYLEEENDWNQTIKAIATMRNCFKTLKPNSIVRPVYKSVAFHLYFHYSFVLQKDQLQNALNLIHNYEQCTQEDMFNIWNDIESVEMNPHAVIVGRNIAQLSTLTTKVLPIDSRTYPCYNYLLFYYFENIQQSKMNTDKFVLRLPTIILQRMSKDHHITRLRFYLQNFDQNYPNTLVNNWDEFDSPEWLSAQHEPHKPIAFRNIVKTLSLYLSYYIGNTKSLPLLDERDGLTLKQAETLQLYQMCLDNFTVFIPTQLYVVHNTTDVDSVQEPVHSLKGLDPVIIKELNAMFDNGKKECLI